MMPFQQARVELLSASNAAAARIKTAIADSEKEIERAKACAMRRRPSGGWQAARSAEEEGQTICRTGRQLEP
eukprot:2649247-Pyramimonas_sp.AAC.1